jgi:hypothetical protein
MTTIKWSISQKGLTSGYTAVELRTSSIDFRYLAAILLLSTANYYQLWLPMRVYKTEISCRGDPLR